MNEESLRELILGQRHKAVAALLRFILNTGSQIYAAVIQLRNFLYSKGWLKTYNAGVPVISIGNITTGGTGKTPLVIWFCNFMRGKRIGCAILTRGYKTTQNLKLKTQNHIDEPAILAQSCPETRLVINPDRVQGAAEAIRTLDTKVLVMDDGFQHRRLARDLDIVTIDATRPFGYCRVLPAGLLREPLSALKRADAAIITRCDQVGEAELGMIEKKLRQINPIIPTARTIHAPVSIKYPDDSEINIEELKDKNIFAFCGIGNPQTFLNTVKLLGANIVGTKIYNDHYDYPDNSAAEIYEQAKWVKANLILTTQKDWTKITPLNLTKKDIPFAYLAIKLKFISGEEKIRQLIEKVLAGKIPASQEDSLIERT